MVAVGTMALVIALSVFNGLENLIQSLYNTFDPEIKIELAKGKSFPIDEDFLNKIQDVPGVELVTQVIEDNAYVRLKDAEMVVVIKGVSDNFLKQQRLDQAIVDGRLILEDNGNPQAILGIGVFYSLNMHRGMDRTLPLQLYYPKRGKLRSLNPQNLTNSKRIMAAGVFAIEKNYDEKYIFVPIDFAEELLEYGDRRTSLEIKTKPGTDIPSLQKNLKSTLGEEFKVLNSNEQHADLLKAIKFEKLFVFLALTFILAIASFNIFFALSMLALEKRKDTAVLQSMGATKKTIKSIFLTEGAIIALGGAFLGLVLGFVICYVQQEFGVFSMGMQTAVQDAYPVKMQLGDFLLTALTIVLITFAASYRPAVLASKVEFIEHL